MIFPRTFIFYIVLSLAFSIVFTPSASFGAKGVKTHYKHYSLFTFESKDYLCEPYLVQKDDWLYKIFRQKGEISAADFPLFLKIFRRLNPQISNIDAILPGSRILIPLKQVAKDAYKQNKAGMVEVPVLEFSADITPETLAQYTIKHEVKAGDTVSQLLPKEFLTPEGTVSEIGEKAFLHLNPDTKDINRIYQGARIVIPDPSILSQPWFRDALTMDSNTQFTTSVPTYIPEIKATQPPDPKILSLAEISQLKRYTQLIQGHLMHQGKLFFPSADGTPRSIDLAQTPIISDSTGRKTVMLGPETTEQDLNPDIVAAMRAYWKDLQFKKLNEALSANMLFKSETMDDIPKSQKSLIKTLLKNTHYTYESDVFFPISVNNIEMTVSLGRITHDRIADILINTGNVYGKAIEAIKKQGYKILNLPPTLNFSEVCISLYSRLGYQVWKNPSFNAGQQIKNIPGVYAEKGTDRHFMTRTPLFKSAISFLENEKIDLITLNKEPAR